MALTVTDIKNLQSDADVKAQGAVAFANELQGIVVDLEKLAATLERFTFFDYTARVKDITTYLNDLISMKDQDPDEPADFGSFSIEDAPTYTPSDMALLREALQKLLTTIDTLPSKVTEAVSIADALYTLLYTDLTLGGYGIEEGDEVALVSRVRDREFREMNAQMDETRDKFAALGYRLPPGALIATLTDLIYKSRSGITEANREIYIKRADLFRESRRFTIEQAQKIATFYIDFTSRKGDMLNNIATSKIAEAKLTVDTFIAQVQAWETKINKVVKEQGLIADVYKIKTDVWKTKVDATATGVTAITEANRINALIEQAQAEGKLKELNLALDIEKEDHLVNVNRVKTIAESYMQIASSILGTVNGIVGLIEETIED
jgi:hypothetical protein